MSSIKFEFSWKTLPWDQFREKLCLIQTQIFNLIKYKNFKNVTHYKNRECKLEVATWHKVEGKKCKEDWHFSGPEIYFTKFW